MHNDNNGTKSADSASLDCCARVTDRRFFLKTAALGTAALAAHAAPRVSDTSETLVDYSAQEPDTGTAQRNLFPLRPRVAVKGG